MPEIPETVSYARTEDGASLWVASRGSGPPALLCHGGPGLWDTLAPLSELIEHRLRVHRFDQRGAGRSTRSGPYTLARFVADVEAVRRHVGCERWIAGGHSWGAALALHFALAHPHRVRALVYISGTGLGDAWRAAYHAGAQALLTPAQRRRVAELGARERSEAEELEWQRLRGSSDFADRVRARALAERAFDGRFAVGYACNRALGAELRRLDEARLAARCRALDVPALIVHGAEDPRPAWALDSLVAALPRAETAVLPGVGHWPWLERPDLLRGVLARFLERVPAEPDRCG